MWVAGEDTADVGEVAHLCTGKEYRWRGIVGGVVALPERVVAAGAWPGAGDEAYLLEVAVWTS
jgi:hypothetical protein